MIAPAVLAFLVEAAVKVAAVVLVGLVAASLLRSQSAALRHWVLAAAVACAWLALPLSAGMPSWLHASVWPAPFGMQPLTESPLVVPTSTPHGGDAPDESLVTSSFAVRPGARSSWGEPSRAFWWLWMLGSLWSAGALLAGLTRLRWLGLHAREVEAVGWTQAANSLRRAHGLSTRVRVLQSDHPSLLITWGWRRPTIVIPAGAEAWSAERIGVVLAHEGAHIRRGDWAAQIAAELLRAACWFNPLLWLVCRRLRDESERACDDAVLAQGTDATVYAGHLVELARGLQTRALPAPAMARPCSLEGRIVAMLNPAMNRRSLSWKNRLATVAALAALTVPIAAVRAQSSFYTFEGIVRDPSDRVLPGATLVLTNGTTSSKYEVRSDAQGQFRFVGLPPSSYQLTTSLAGFAPLNLTVNVTGNISRDLRLKVGSLEETITVVGDVSPPAPPDPATLERREAARRRYEELVERSKARCAAGAAGEVVGGNILAPRKLVDVRPTYPEHLKAARIGGIVTMDAVIGTDGLVSDIQNLHGPDPALESAAADAVRQWQFSSTLLNCEAIEVDMHVTTNFRPEP